MKINLELDLTADEFKDLFVPGERQTEFAMKTYDAYVEALRRMVLDQIDPNNFTGMNKKNR